MAAKKKSKRASSSPKPRKATKRASSKRSSTKRSSKKSPSKRSPKALSDKAVASAFSRAVRAGSKTMARKLARELKRRSPYGMFSSEHVSASDVAAFESLGKRRVK